MASRATVTAIFWFDVNPGRRGLGKLDTKTEKISVYQTPSTMSPLGGAVTMDVDGKGKIWASAADGAVRFDPVTEQFTDFKSVRPRTTRRKVPTDLRRRGRPRRQRLVGTDGARHRRPRRYRHRQGDRNGAARA